MSGDFFNTVFLGNKVISYAIAIAIFAGGFIAANILQSIILKSLRKWAKKTATRLDDGIIHVIEHTLIPLLYLGIVYIAVDNLILHPILRQFIDVLAVGIATFLGVRFFNEVIEKCLRVYCLRKADNNPTLEQTFKAFFPAIRAFVWAIGLIFLLDNLGFNISAVVASLGIGGVAIALASQGVLQDLFSYFAILLDRPFELGDFIVVGDFCGTVEQVGIKTTRLKSLSGEELILANTDLTGSRIRNFKRMQKRRIAFEVSVAYDTPPDVLQTIPALIQSIIEEVKTISFDRAHFYKYGKLGLDFEAIYFVNTSDYNEYMNAQQHINVRLKQEFEMRSIKFANLAQSSSSNNLSSAPS
jgi:small-conductance mechanosensitive channel